MERDVGNCESEFLWDELSALEPHIVLAIGKTDNYVNIENIYRGHKYEIKDKHEGTHIIRASLKKGTQRLWLFGVRHPAAVPDLAKKAFAELFILETSKSMLGRENIAHNS